MAGPQQTSTTVASLAAAVGLSPGAVSRILNHKGRFPEATRERVLRRAAELGFRPNLSARATRTRRFETIAVLTITPDAKGVLFQPLLSGVLAAASARGHRVMIDACDDRALGEVAAQPGLLRERMCDGLIVNYHLPPPPAIRDAVAGCGVPVVWLNLRLDAACVHPNDHAAGRRLAEELIARGHRRIAYLDLTHVDADLGRDHYSAADRRQGAADACAAAGLRLRLHIPPRRLDHDGNLAFVRPLLSGADRPDAIIAYTADHAQCAWQAAAGLGLAIPRDLSLAMFSDVAAIAGMPVDAMLIPFAGIGARAADLLLDAVDGGGPIPAVALPLLPSLGNSVISRR